MLATSKESGSVHETYSRSATVGASLDARRAGNHVANTLAKPSPLMARAKDDAFNGVNPYSNGAGYRRVTPARAAPMALPPASRPPPSGKRRRLQMRR